MPYWILLGAQNLRWVYCFRMYRAESTARIIGQLLVLESLDMGLRNLRIPPESFSRWAKTCNIWGCAILNMDVRVCIKKLPNSVPEPLALGRQVIDNILGKRIRNSIQKLLSSHIVKLGPYVKVLRCGELNRNEFPCLSWATDKNWHSTTTPKPVYFRSSNWALKQEHNLIRWISNSNQPAVIRKMTCESMMYYCVSESFHTIL